MGTEIQHVGPAQPVAAGIVARQQFGSREIEVRAETAGEAIGAQAAALVAARFTLALQRPRDMLAVRNHLIAAMSRPRFAASARYSKPQGKAKVKGWSIRFAEECARALGNLQFSEPRIYETATTRTIRVSVLDLQTNNGFEQDIAIDKTVERSDPYGRRVISERLNTSGQTAYLVEATEDELTVKKNALASKVRRNWILALVPSDILEECLDVYEEAMRGETKDPSIALKNLADGFSRLGIPLDQVAQYLGHPLEQSTAEERTNLIEIGTLVRDGEMSWKEVMASRGEERAASAAPAADARPRTVADLKAQERKRQEQKIAVLGVDGKPLDMAPVDTPEVPHAG